MKIDELETHAKHMDWIEVTRRTLDCGVTIMVYQSDDVDGEKKHPKLYRVHLLDASTTAYVYPDGGGAWSRWGANHLGLIVDGRSLEAILEIVTNTLVYDEGAP